MPSPTLDRPPPIARVVRPAAAPGVQALLWDDPGPDADGGPPGAASSGGASAEPAAVATPPASASAPEAEADRALAALPPPEVLHPALWRAHQLGRPREAVLSTGHAALDAELPGGGWPRQALTELLLPHAGLGEMRLLAPALAALVRAGRTLMLFDPPAMPCARAWGQLGLDSRQLVVVRARDGLQGRARQLLPAADTLWAIEQALKSGHVGAVLAWLPTRMRAEALRRLQLAAQQHDGPAFVLRDDEARTQPSPAPLRLLLGAAGGAHAAPDVITVRLLKRRGPPMLQPLRLALPAVAGAGVDAVARAVTPGATGSSGATPNPSTGFAACT